VLHLFDPNAERSFEVIVKSFFALCASDLDGDGSVEIVGGTAEGGLKIFTLENDRWHEVKVSGLPQKGLARIYNIYVVDLNRDGREDIVVNYAMGGQTDNGGIRAFLNLPHKD